jgi:hypothetical protein
MRIVLLFAPLLLALVLAVLGQRGMAGRRVSDLPSELAARLPFQSLAWIPSSRTVRSPGTEENSAPISDGPNAVDADPASGTLFLGGDR